MKSLIYAPRVKGDLDLGLEPSRIAHGNRRWAEINAPGGRLPGQPYQDILETVTTPRYRIGTRRMIEDRVFHYCFASTEGGLGPAPTHTPIVYAGAPQSMSGCFYNSNVHYHGNGATQVPIAVNAREFDWAYAVAPTRHGNIGIAAHQLRDAMFVSYAERLCCRIADNDAYVSSNGDVGIVHLYLKERVWKNSWVAPATSSSYVYPNTYAQCVHPDIGIAHDTPSLPYVAQDGAGLGYGAVVAVPLINMTAPCYFWGQTWGPIPIINGKWGINVGDRPNQRIWHFDWYGRIVHRGTSDVDSHMQFGGVVLSSQFLILQLAP